MKSTSSSFAQLLQLLPQASIRKIVREEHGESCAKGFTCKMQLVAMLYLQLAQAKSLFPMIFFSHATTRPHNDTRVAVRWNNQV